MTLDDLLTALRRHRWPAVLVGTLVLLVAAGAAVMPSDRYTASASIVVQPADAGELGPFSAAVEVLLPTLAATVESRSTDQAVRDRVPERLAAADVELSARPEPGVGLLVVTAESAQQQAVAPYADAAVEVLLAQQRGDVAGLRLQVLDPARVPSGPSGPARGGVLLAGMVLAALLAVLTAVVAQSLARRTELSDLVPRVTGLPVLGEVPRLRGRAQEALTPRALASAPDPRVIEAMQQIRIGLDNAGRGRTPERLAVTSLRAGEGKSSIAAALCWSQATAGYPVVLVDADLRRPKQHEHFGLPLEPGLSDGDVRGADELVRRSGLEPTLDVVPAGVPARHPLEVLDAALPPVLEAMSAPVGRMVVVDTPPLESVAETLRALVLVRDVVLVVDARQVDLDHLQRAVDRLRAADVRVLGVVLNHVRVTRRARQDGYYNRPAVLRRDTAAPASAGAPAERPAR